MTIGENVLHGRRIAEKLIVVGMVAGAWAAMAMPTRQELAQAKPLVQELMNDELKAFKARKKTAAEVGELALEYADKAEKEAVKYLLLEDAVEHFIAGEEYDKAADTVGKLMAEVKAVPPSVVVEVISRSSRRVDAQKAPRLFRQYQAARVQVGAQKELAVARRAAAAKPMDSQPRRQLAERLAAVGDWKGALVEFAKLEGTAEGRAAANELAGKELLSVADFWWEFKPMTLAADGEVFRVHAAALYKRLVLDSGLDGLKRTLVEKRVKAIADLWTEGGHDEVEDVVGEVTAADDRKPLSSFGMRPITITLADGTEPVEFVYVKPGEFLKVMGYNPNMKLEKSRLTYPFWIARKPLTWAQYSGWTGDDYRIKKLEDTGIGDAGRNMLACLPHDIVLPQLEHVNDEKYGSQLPRGHVLRLISDAEYHRVLFLGYGKNVFRGKWSDKVVPTPSEKENARNNFYEKLGDGFAGTIPLKRPDNLGVWGMLGYGRTLVLDRYLPNQVALAGKVNDIGSGALDNYLIAYPAKDPFFYVSENVKLQVSVPVVDLVTKNRWVTRVEMKNLASMSSLIRLVIGPDLVSEWMKKNGGK